MAAGHTQAQLNNSVVVQRLLAPDVRNTQITPFSGAFSRFIDSGFANRPGHFIKEGGRLFCWFTSSGRLYEIKRDSLGIIRSYRLDRTVMEGYNVVAFPFAYKGLIYNMGGYGYWRTNGQLRIYDPKAGEWDIVKLNKELPFIFSSEEGCLWYDAANGLIYLGFQMIRNQAISEERELVSEFHVLDLQTRQWTSLGETNSYLKNKYYSTGPLFVSRLGLLTSIQDQPYLLDFAHNKILAIKDSYKPTFNITQSTEYGEKLFFEGNDKLYLADPVANKLDSIPFGLVYFKDTGLPIYTKPTMAPKAVVASLGLAFFAIAGVAFWRRRKKRNVSQPNAVKRPGLSSQPQALLSERERAVLQLIYNQTCNNLTTSIEDLNDILGLSQKNIDVQKKQRSDVIISINKALAAALLVKDEVIGKNRREFDRRSFEYFIKSEYLSVVGEILQDQPKI